MYRFWCHEAQRYIFRKRIRCVSTFKLDVTVLHTVLVCRNILLIISSRLPSHEESQLQGFTVLLVWRGFQPLVVGSLYSSRSLFCGRKLCGVAPKNNYTGDHLRWYSIQSFGKQELSTVTEQRSRQDTVLGVMFHLKDFFIYKTIHSGQKALLFREKTPLIFTFPNRKINELVVWIDNCLYMYKTNGKSGMSSNNHERQNQRKSLEVIILEHKFTCIFYGETN